jgi:hypothetical protein
MNFRRSLLLLLVLCVYVVIAANIVSEFGFWLFTSIGFVQLTIVSVVLFIAWLSRPRKYRYTFVSWCDFPLEDNRADSISVGKLKHADALYAKVLFKSQNSNLWCLNFWQTVRTRILIVSLEVLSQITTAANLQLGSTDEIVAERIQYCARNLQSVSISRYLPLEGVFVVQDSVLVAFALHKSLEEKRLIVPFPRSPARMMIL